MGPILLVDDHYDFRLMTRDLLERQGYHVISVGSTAEAYQVLLKQTVSLLITDLYVPGMSGIELLRRLRSMGKPVPPVIAVTGYEFLSSDAARATLEGLGAKAVLKKPIDSAELLKHIASAMTGAEPRLADDTGETKEA
jgi:CheY-like chemotaxis protein